MITTELMQQLQVHANCIIMMFNFMLYIHTDEQKLKINQKYTKDKHIMVKMYKLTNEHVHAALIGFKIVL